MATQMTVESGQLYPYTLNALLDGALGPNGYTGDLRDNMHTDWNPWPSSDLIVATCQSRGVPVISSRQMLDWLDGRNGSAFGAPARDGDSLRFTISTAPGARGLMGMLPLLHGGGVLGGIGRDGQALSWTVHSVKGIRYAFFPA